MAVALAVLAFLGGLIGLGANVDNLARHREEAQARNALQGEIKEVDDQVITEANWDTAVEHASNRIDLDWITQNIGAFFSQPGRFQFVYLLDPANREVFGTEKGRRVPPSHFSPLSTPAAKLIEKVRAQELRRGAFGPVAHNGQMISKAIQADEIVRYRGRSFILTASLIQPDFGYTLPTGPRASIIVTGKAIDGPFLRTMGDRLLLRDIRMLEPDERGPAQIDLTDRHGQRLARIAWKPQHPGADLVAIAFLPILLGVSLPLLLYLNGQRTARRLRVTLGDLVRARDEADTANAHKSRFLATMSHEIRTPLNGVMAMAQVMSLNPLSPSQRKRLSVISQSSETLLIILNDILDISKIEAGRLELDVRAFDLGDLAEAVAGLYAPIAGQKGLDLQVELAPEAAGRWVGDPDRLRQVIANLLANALKFTERGRIRLHIRPAAPGGLRIEVSDTGIGVPADKLDVIFDSFSQADSSTARRYGGTGLGLAIGRQLVEAMGGRLWVESREGAGSTFGFEVPLTRAPGAAEALAAAGARPPQGRLRVLAADDNATNRQLLAAILEPLEVELDLRDDGAAALAAWRGGDYDLILMDVQMPVLDGIAATRRIRAEEAETGRARTPIIALTANAMPHQQDECRAAGMEDCIAKPIRIADLHSAVLRVTAGDSRRETDRRVTASN